ncbi:16S rRNA (guanine(966)-N(2))-methyltransferase RsmD [Alteromonas sp. CYL-A6]|uniref:16S rRNA (guanine(966)-N(2))-methyltransferase RsmD n=1 Tax=Alteromonas nitratireducens TaxID=3390813 RepID=UPI0034BF2244
MITLSAIMKRVTKKRSPSSAAGTVRVIAGQWRGRRLPVRDANGLRPTTDRNKETLFNWLMSSVQEATCLDMFAGSGALGIEALSRYARYCVFFEKDKQTAEQLKQNLVTLGAHARVEQGDALQLLSSAKDLCFDLVFLDPPFGQALLQPAIDALAASRCVKPGTLIYAEYEATATPLTLPDKWEWTKQKSTSSLHYGLIEVA